MATKMTADNFVKGCMDLFNEFKQTRDCNIKDGGPGSGRKGHTTPEEAKKAKETVSPYYNDKKYEPITKGELSKHQEKKDYLDKKINEINENRERMITNHMKQNNITEPSKSKKELLNNPSFQKILSIRKDLREKRDKHFQNIRNKHGVDLENNINRA